MESTKKSAIFPDNDSDNGEAKGQNQAFKKSGLLDTSSDDLDENGGFSLDDMGTAQN